MMEELYFGVRKPASRAKTTRRRKSSPVRRRKSSPVRRRKSSPVRRRSSPVRRRSSPVRRRSSPVRRRRSSPNMCSKNMSLAKLRKLANEHGVSVLSMSRTSVNPRTGERYNPKLIGCSALKSRLRDAGLEHLYKDVEIYDDGSDDPIMAMMQRTFGNIPSLLKKSSSQKEPVLSRPERTFGSVLQGVRDSDDDSDDDDDDDLSLNRLLSVLQPGKGRSNTLPVTGRPLLPVVPVRPVKSEPLSRTYGNTPLTQQSVNNLKEELKEEVREAEQKAKVAGEQAEVAKKQAEVAGKQAKDAERAAQKAKSEADKAPDNVEKSEKSKLSLKNYKKKIIELAKATQTAEATKAAEEAAIKAVEKKEEAADAVEKASVDPSKQAEALEAVTDSIQADKVAATTEQAAAAAAAAPEEEKGFFATVGDTVGAIGGAIGGLFGGGEQAPAATAEQETEEQKTSFGFGSRVRRGRRSSPVRRRSSPMRRRRSSPVRRRRSSPVRRRRSSPMRRRSSPVRRTSSTSTRTAVAQISVSGKLRNLYKGAKGGLYYVKNKNKVYVKPESAKRRRSPLRKRK